MIIIISSIIDTIVFENVSLNIFIPEIFTFDIIILQHIALNSPVAKRAVLKSCMFFDAFFMFKIINTIIETERQETKI